MCGIAGIVDFSLNQPRLNELVEKMKHSIVYRGPDDEGSYFADGIALGHRRLAIIDPAHGAQPMISNDGSIIVIFNGAIYNFLALRRELLSLGFPIKTYSDTEVILYAYLAYGEACVEKFRGMFAFTILDKNKKLLFSARDRVGVKPFYFYFNQNRFIFASEIKAILATNLVNAQPNTKGLQDYISFQFCLNGKTLFKEIESLEPGFTLTVRFDKQHLTINKKKYWDLNYAIDDSHDESYYIDQLGLLLENAVDENLHSDVPIGAHLSGGLDSSTVVSIAASKLNGSSFKTFTGAFKEGIQFDETMYAKIVAETSASIYHEIFIPSHEFSNILPKLIYHMDEPAAGPGLIPQYYVSKFASKQVKVVLGGQGGDEIYIGYMRYLVAYLEKCLQGAIFETSKNDGYATTLERIIPNLSLLKPYLPMLSAFWQNGLFEELDRRYFSLIDRSNGMGQLFNKDIFDGYSPFASFQSIFNRTDIHSYINKMTYFDLKASLPALLQVEDRTSMAASLESRVPLLDHRLIEFMAKVPPKIKFAGGKPKHLLSQAVKHFIPERILQRKDKKGFPVPFDQWVKGHANEFVRDILFSTKARQRGLYNLDEIERVYNNERQFSRLTWGLLSLELWHRIFIDKDITVYA